MGGHGFHRLFHLRLCILLHLWDIKMKAFYQNASIQIKVVSIKNNVQMDRLANLQILSTYNKCQPGAKF